MPHALNDCFGKYLRSRSQESLLVFTSVAIGVFLDDYGAENALLTISFTLLGLLYILSRVSFLVVSFATLRSHPASTFQTVKWTLFLPHIQRAFFAALFRQFTDLLTLFTSQQGQLSESTRRLQRRSEFEEVHVLLAQGRPRWA
jgi:hypothetical protein